MKSNWTVQDSADLYLISRWGAPYFSINENGHLTCSPTGDASKKIDLKELVDDLCRRGIAAPLLVRFNDILRSRIEVISNSFKKSIQEYGYKNTYRSVMPIKVNQQRHVIEQIVQHGKDFNLGLEAGSKPELLVAIALMEPENSLLICNGYKDAEYIETALHSQKLGLRPVIVLDRYEELKQIIDSSKKLGVSPSIGMRAKLSSRGKGRWEESSGDRSKFGLSAREMIRAMETLKQENMLDCIRLVHFHVGSQITSIRAVKGATREMAQLYCNLRKMGCTNLDHVDVGGGLAVDYDGSQTDFHSSMNYSLQEYANDVVSTLQDICDENEQPHPTIVSESGRALVAHHAMLVFNLLGAHEMAGSLETPAAPTEDDHGILHIMWEAFQSISRKSFQEAYNDAVSAKEESVTLFAHGVIDLETKARVDDLFWAISHRIWAAVKNMSYVPEELEGLKKQLSDTFYCNFSVFQSLPDSWAIGHLFPIAPLHRLNEEPTREAVIVDLTCDSDGKIDKFIDLRDVKETLRLHKPNGSPYYMGAFLVGAYQEILGDLHNLFGDTNAVHVTLREEGGYRLDHLVQGDTVSEVLGYVEYDRADLVRRVRAATENAVRDGKMSFEQSAKFIRYYEEGLAGYTYLEDID